MKVFAIFGVAMNSTRNQTPLHRYDNVMNNWFSSTLYTCPWDACAGGRKCLYKDQVEVVLYSSAIDSSLHFTWYCKYLHSTEKWQQWPVSQRQTTKATHSSTALTNQMSQKIFRMVSTQRQWQQSRNRVLGDQLQTSECNACSGWISQPDAVSWRNRFQEPEGWVNWSWNLLAADWLKIWTLRVEWTSFRCTNCTY